MGGGRSISLCGHLNSGSRRRLVLQCGGQKLQGGRGCFCCFPSLRLLHSKVSSESQKQVGFFDFGEAALSGGHHVQTRRREVFVLACLWFPSQTETSGPQGSKQIPKGLEIQHSVYLFVDCVTLSVAFLTSVDIKDVYLHIPIFQPHQQFLQFTVKDCHYQFVALSLVFPQLPEYFTRC